jgi:hypothetical protein
LSLFQFLASCPQREKNILDMAMLIAPMMEKDRQGAVAFLPITRMLPY